VAVDGAVVGSILGRHITGKTHTVAADAPNPPIDGERNVLPLGARPASVSRLTARWSSFARASLRCCV
jgi:hypothetical protein